jgi:predicted RNA binding protein YcfA (HicA-like mRNA interferase family)
MKIPRDVNAIDLIKKLKKFNYEVSRQTGSHIRLTRTSESTTHHITIPNHNPIKIGTLNNILKDISESLAITKEHLLKELFD